MSQLTQGAQDLRSAQERLKTGNFFTDFIIDRVEDSVRPDGKGGTKTTGGWGFLGDRLGIDSTEIRKRREAFNTRVETDTAIDDSGATRAELEEAAGKPITRAADVNSAVRALTRAENEEQTKDTRQYETQIRSEGYKQAAETLGAQIAAGDRRADQTARISLAQMQLGQLQANNQFEIAQMNNRLQMRREDAKEARLERKDRQAAIQQMMAGLAQMGASIAI